MAIAAVILEFVDGPDRGRTVRISDLGPTLLGRGSDADVRLPAVDAAVSRHQAYIALSRDGCVLTRVDGSNAVVDVNHAPLAVSRALEDRDVVRVGSTVLRVGLTLTDPTCVVCGKSVDEITDGEQDEHADIGTPAHEVCVDALGWTWRKINGLEIGQPLCGGAADAPHHAYDRSVRRLWAIRWFPKMRADDGNVQALIAIRHPNIIRCIRVGTDEDVPYVVTELARHGSLADHVRRGDCRPKSVVALMEDVLEALAFVHALGRVHGNVHPRSIVVQREMRGAGSRDRGKLVDLGMGGRVRADLPSTAAVNWYPPERRFRAIDLGDDVYAAAAVLFSLLGDQLIDRAPRIPLPLATVLDRARHDDPARRFRSAQELRDALRNVWR